VRKKHPRVIGTTEEAIARAEKELGRPLPPSFRSWLLSNNGHDLEHVHIFPVLDDRDPRKTWDSIVRIYREVWPGWAEIYSEEPGDYAHLLPFAEDETGDYYCFDYSLSTPEKECPVVWWDHETGEYEEIAPSFQIFTQRVLLGELDEE
jgi:cell wall assembly regulator SMI1